MIAQNLAVAEREFSNQFLSMTYEDYDSNPSYITQIPPSVFEKLMAI